MAAARTLRVAALGLNVASAIRFSNKKAEAKAEGPIIHGDLNINVTSIFMNGDASSINEMETSVQEDGSVDEVQAASCSGVPGFVFDAVRGVANQLLGSQLPGFDPQDFSLRGIEQEIDLTSWCSLGVDLNTSLHMTGYGNSKVSTLECASAKCVESGGLFGCRKSEFEFATRISTPELLHLYGIAVGDFSLCGITVGENRETTIGAKTRDPGVSATLAVEFTWSFPPQAKIVGIREVSGDLGSLENFECGFSALPDFIGSRLEAMCEKIGEWLVEKTGEHVLPLVKAILERLLGAVVPMEEYA